jgi:hypothetical protein
MAVRSEMVRQQCTLKSAADLLSLNFVFTRAFLENNLPPETASRLSQQPVANPRGEDVDLLLSCCLNVGSADYQHGRAYIKGRTAQQDGVAVTSYRPMHLQESCVIEPRNLLSTRIPTLSSQ